MSKKYRLLAILLSVLLVFSGWGGLLPEQLLAADDDQPDLFFSEYGHGKKITNVSGTSGNNKYLEIYNPSSYPINIEDYEIFISFNGGNSERTIKLKPNYPDESPGPSTIEPGGVYVICKKHDDVSQDILDHANQRDNNIDFNGDDAIVLRKIEVSTEDPKVIVVDRIGQVDHKDDWMENVTYVRKSNIEGGDPNHDQVFSVTSGWDKKPVNYFDNLGQHKMDRHYVTFDAGEGSFSSGKKISQWVPHGDQANPPDPDSIILESEQYFNGWLPSNYSNITKPLIFTAQYEDFEPDLFFSEYVESGTGFGDNKALEIYNPLSTAIQLTAYSITIYANGAKTTDPEDNNSVKTLSLDAYSIDPGNVLTIFYSQASSDFKSSLIDPKVEWDRLDFNGDDAIVLYKNGVAIDRIGQVGVQPSGGWGTSDLKTQDMTLLRKPGILWGDRSSGEFDPSNQWYSIGKNNYDDLGVTASVKRQEIAGTF